MIGFMPHFSRSSRQPVFQISYGASGYHFIFEPMKVFACLFAVLGCAVSSLCAANIVVITVEDPDNYDAPRTLGDFARNQLEPLGHSVSFVLGDRPRKHAFEGLAAKLENADLAILFCRRRFPPLEHMSAIRAYLDAGRPLVGMRTANHAFSPRPGENVDEGLSPWRDFAREVLGCENAGYETKGLPYRVSAAEQAQASADPELLRGVDASRVLGHQSLYKVLPLADHARVLLTGTAGEGATSPPQPVAWTRRYGPGNARIFYTSLGAPQDMEISDVQRLLLNAVLWALKKD